MLNNDVVEILASAVNSNIIHIPEDAAADEMIAWYEILKNLK